MAGGEELARSLLAGLEERGLLRSLEPLASPAGPEIELARAGGGRERLINFSSNDYLGLAAHPAIAAALAEGAQRWGVGAGASRLVTGDFTAHRELEAALAAFEGVEAALLCSSGYAANSGAIGALVGPGDLVLSDALNHASLIDGCRLSRARIEVFPHADAEALERALARARGGGAAGGGEERAGGARVLVVTDAIFSMDGDRAPLAEIARACDRHGALLFVDEAHATGVVGPRGAGLSAELGLGARVDVRMGTLSKAAGVVGGWLGGGRAICQLFANRARPFVYSTALPPALAVAARQALALLAGPEGDARRALLWTLVRRFAAGLRALGLPAAESSPIFPVVLGSPERALAAAAALRARGLLVKAIRPPTVPAGTSRLRIALSAAHSEAHVDALLAGLRPLV